MYEKIFKTNKNFISETKKVLPWFVAGLFLLLLHSQHQLNSDEGIVLNAAWNIINGKNLYLNTFEFYPPLTPYLLAWWWKITEPSFLSAVFLSYLISFSGAIGLYLISKKIGLKKWLFLPSALFILSSSFWTLINHNAYNLAAIIWFVYFFIKALAKTKNSKYYFLLSGLLAGLSVLFLQHRGLIVILVALIFLVWLKYKKQINFKEFNAFTLGAILPIISLFIFWSPIILYKDLWLFPLQNYPATNRLPLFLWLACLIIGLVISACVVLRIDKKQCFNIVFLQFLSLGLLITSLSRADATHIFQALALFTIIIALSFEFYLTKKQDKRLIALLMALGMLFFIPRPLFETATVNMVRQKLNQYCPNPQTIYAGPFMPGVYFEKRTLNTIPYSFMIPGQQTKEQFEEVVNYFSLHKPDCVILNYAVVEKFDYNKNNILDNFINANYKKVDSVGNVYIYTQK